MWRTASSPAMRSCLLPLPGCDSLHCLTAVVPVGDVTGVVFLWVSGHVPRGGGDCPRGGWPLLRPAVGEVPALRGLPESLHGRAPTALPVVPVLPSWTAYSYCSLASPVRPHIFATREASLSFGRVCFRHLLKPCMSSCAVLQSVLGVRGPCGRRLPCPGRALPTGSVSVAPTAAWYLWIFRAGG